MIEYTSEQIQEQIDANWEARFNLIVFKNKMGFNQLALGLTTEQGDDRRAVTYAVTELGKSLDMLMNLLTAQEARECNRSLVAGDHTDEETT